MQTTCQELRFVASTPCLSAKADEHRCLTTHLQSQACFQQDPNHQQLGPMQLPWVMTKTAILQQLWLEQLVGAA